MTAAAYRSIRTQARSFGARGYALYYERLLGYDLLLRSAEPLRPSQALPPRGGAGRRGRLPSKGFEYGQSCKHAEALLMRLGREQSRAAKAAASAEPRASDLLWNGG
jgi:hypothetical protein